jgi:CheY-specific phosphatase CheX
MSMQTFSPDDIDAITLLAFEHAAGTLLAPADQPGASSLCAFVDVTGPWVCRVVVCLDAELARVVAQRMWDDDAVTDDDVVDAVKEMANVIGGAVKGMTPLEGCGLTIPEPAEPSALTGIVRHYRVGPLAASVSAHVLSAGE